MRDPLLGSLALEMSKKCFKATGVFWRGEVK